MSSRNSAGVAVRKVKKKKAPPQPGIVPSSVPLYSVHPGVAMVQKWIAELKPKTGRSLDQWLRHIKSAGLPDEKSCRIWLNEVYGVGTNTAWWLAEKAFGNTLGLAEDTPEKYLASCPAYVAGMYAGSKSQLRPIHDELVSLAQRLGEEVRICPCKTIVPIYRRHVVAQIKPTTNKRIDLGLALGDEPFTSRLLDTGGRAKKDRITHRVALTSLDEIDLQVKRWLREAYERDA